jgi:hypothetical protein
MDQNTPRDAGFGTTTGSDRGTGINTTSRSEVCPTCGQLKNAGLEQFLGRLGISEEIINTLTSQMQNVNVEEYLNTARDYLKTGSEKLKTGSDKAAEYAKQNPGKVAAGVAALAVGAGLLISSLNRD